MVSTNFSGELVRRCSDSSRLINAKTNEICADISALVAQNAGFFISLGLNPGDRIIITCRLSPASALAYLGAMYAGLVAVLIDASNLCDITKYIDLTEARAVWSENDDSLNLQIAPEVLYINANQIAGFSVLPPPVPRNADDLAALMPTSGSTGNPRFVKVSHGNLLSNTEAIVRSQRLSCSESAMLVLPLSYCFGASVLHSHLYCGGSVVFDSRFMFPDKVLRSIADYGCTTFAGVPSVYKILLSRSSISTIPMPSLRRVIQAGGHLEWEQIEKFASVLPDVAFFVMYGQTEATSRIACLEPEKLFNKKGSVGKPLDNLKLRIVDESGASLPAQQSGAIQVSGPSVCHGYWNDPDETSAKFNGAWLNTNDLGRVDEEGYVWIEGRNGDFLKVRGKRLSFGEIGQRVLSVNGVCEAAVCALPHEEAGEVPAVFVVPDKGVLHEELSGRIKSALPPAWTCEKIVIIDHLPLTDRGKLNREALNLLLDDHENS